MIFCWLFLSKKNQKKVKINQLMFGDNKNCYTFANRKKTIMKVRSTRG